MDLMATLIRLMLREAANSEILAEAFMSLLILRLPNEWRITHLIEKIYNMENIGPTHHQISELLIDERISDMMQYLMEDYDYTLEQALDDVYSSKTIKWLQIEEAELYVQSSAYIYEILINELGLYPVFDKK